VLAYLDYNVYTFIQEKGDPHAVRRLFGSFGVRVFGSTQVLIEAIRTPDVGLRGERVKAILAIVDRRERQSRGYQAYMQVLSELRRCHPDWLHQAPVSSSVQNELRWVPSLWRQLRMNPTYRPAGFRASEPSNRLLLGGNRLAQRRRRQARLRGERTDFDPYRGPLKESHGHKVRAMSEPEAHPHRPWHLQAPHCPTEFVFLSTN
jgi:hypothetical protein